MNNSTGQELQVFLKSDSGDVTFVEGISLFAAIGGTAAIQPSTPKFESFEFSPNVVTSFDFPFEGPVRVPEDGYPHRASTGISDFGSSPPPPGNKSFTVSGSTETLIGTFRLNTTGVFDQRFSFFIGQANNFDPGSEAASVLNINNGNSTDELFFATVAGTTFDVGSPTAVPEPASCVLCGLAVAGFAVRRRRRSIGLQHAA